MYIHNIFGQDGYMDLLSAKILPMIYSIFSSHSYLAGLCYIFNASFKANNIHLGSMMISIN